MAIASTLLLATLLAACASQPPHADAITFVLVRHAEKADDSKDPPLTTEGEARAQKLAAGLDEAPLRAVYATAYKRTQATAAPSAGAHSLPVTTYDAKLPARDFAAQLRREYHDGTVLVVGHSNTVPDIAAALCQCSVLPIGDAEYDRRITIHVDAQGRAAMQVDRY
ncbi:phosphoglycerate mutase family protein [Agrilutibacter niabensis]|nr:phosphoglycerate mutase family protein [Lysobacter niabensis]